MPRKKTNFDAVQIDRFLAYIRNGAYPLPAAEAAGLPREVISDWLGRGEQAKAREPFRTFVRQVREAAAWARVRAELAVYEKDPKFWLGHGPGRETAALPGWTGEVKAGPERETTAPSSNPQWMALSRVVLQALSAFPDARLAVAEALRQLDGA